jgi:SUN domain-containing protein 1/2
MYEESLQATPSSGSAIHSSIVSGTSEVTKEDLERLITELRDLWKLDMEEALETFDADRTGLVDYAVKSAGGSIVAASPTLVACNLWPFLCSLLIPAKKPDEMITQLMGVGNCWPMQGQHGQALIKLREPVYVTGVTLQHVSSAIAPDTTTTPKEFSIWAVLDEQVEAVVNEIVVESKLGHPPVISKSTEHGHHYETGISTTETTGSILGRFTYVNGTRAIQYFTIADVHQTPVSHIRFILHSKYGNPNYTCIYRLRVHGRPARHLHE